MDSNNIEDGFNLDEALAGLFRVKSRCAYSILVFDREGARSGKTMKNGQTVQIRTSSNIRNKKNKTKNSEEKFGEMRHR